MIDRQINGRFESLDEFHQRFPGVAGQGGQHDVLVRGDRDIAEGRDSAEFDVAARFEDLRNMRPRR